MRVPALVALTGGYVSVYVVCAMVCVVGRALVGRIVPVEAGARGD
jgi:hypothetical protein